MFPERLVSALIIELICVIYAWLLAGQSDRRIVQFVLHASPLDLAAEIEMMEN